MLRLYLIGLVMMLAVSSQMCNLTSILPSTSPPTSTPGLFSEEENAYLRFLNLSAMPKDITDFSGEGSEAIVDFMSSGFFTYQASEAYFDFLVTHDNFKELSEFNEQIHEVNCTSVSFPKDFSWWTNAQIELEGKRCFSGVYFPYVHHMIYDEADGEVYHFVEGMRG